MFGGCHQHFVPVHCVHRNHQIRLLLLVPLRGYSAVRPSSEKVIFMLTNESGIEEAKNFIVRRKGNSNFKKSEELSQVSAHVPAQCKREGVSCRDWGTAVEKVYHD